jgi:hypothetical protein
VYEIVAIAVGVGIGVVAYRLDSRARVAAIVVGGLLTGFAVSLLSGELEISPGFLLFDCGQVMLAAVCAMALVEAVNRRRDTA